jgi:hypothetical protein
MIYAILFIAVLPAQYFLGWIGMMAAVMILSPGKKLVPWKAALVTTVATLAVAVYRDSENHFLASARLSAMFGVPGHFLVYAITAAVAFVSAFLTVKAATTTFPKRKSADFRGLSVLRD